MCHLRPILSLAFVLILLIAASAQAQDRSNIGLFADEMDLTSYTCTHTGGPLTLFLVLMNPFYEQVDYPDTPVAAMGGFECRLEAPASYFLATVSFPVNGLNIGTMPNMIVGYSEPVPVIDGRCTVGTVTLFGDGSDDIGLYLKPITQTPEYPGHMAGVGYISEDPIVVESFRMYPYSGSHDAPVFIANPTGAGPVATEDVSWGDVKSLYR